MTVTAMDDFGSQAAVSHRSGRKKTICRTHPGETEWEEFDSFTQSRREVEVELVISVCASCHKEGYAPNKFQLALNFFKDDENAGATRVFHSIHEGRNWLMGKNLTFNFLNLAEWFKDPAVSADRTLEKVLFELVDQMDGKYQSSVDLS